MLSICGICSVNGTVDFQGRQHEISFTLNPYTGSSALSFTDAQKSLTLSYKSTLLYTERGGAATTSLDGLGVRAATGSDPEVPIPSSTINRLTLDCEGLVLNADGRYAVPCYPMNSLRLMLAFFLKLLG